MERTVQRSRAAPWGWLVLGLLCLAPFGVVAWFTVVNSGFDMVLEMLDFIYSDEVPRPLSVTGTVLTVGLGGCGAASLLHCASLAQASRRQRGARGTTSLR